jgi:translation initiation factor IF-3
MQQRTPDNRINDRVRAPEVRLIGADGSQVGVVSREHALGLAETAGLDLVEVAPNADPPVCKIMDYGKFKYQESLRAKEARKKQGHQQVKEMRFGPKIGIHDYDTKKARIIEFLSEGHRVKVSVRFKGREMHHTELGTQLLQRLMGDLAEAGSVEVPGKLDGRIMSMMFAPQKKQLEKPAKPKSEKPPETETPPEIETPAAEEPPEKPEEPEEKDV